LPNVAREMKSRKTQKRKEEENGEKPDHADVRA
jgi:hypothetical protein